MEKIKKNIQWYFLGLLLVATFLVWYAVFAASQQDLIVAFLNVGRGDADMRIHANDANVVRNVIRIIQMPFVN